MRINPSPVSNALKPFYDELDRQQGKAALQPPRAHQQLVRMYAASRYYDSADEFLRRYQLLAVREDHPHATERARDFLDVVMSAECILKVEKLATISQRWRQWR
jgi:hypothetical protein